MVLLAGQNFIVHTPAREFLVENELEINDLLEEERVRTPAGQPSYARITASWIAAQ
jgi:hypothetical protein